jgi:hypothetical protein
LPAFLVHRLHIAPGHVGHQQFDRVGADINYGAAGWLHERVKITRGTRKCPSEKDVAAAWNQADNWPKTMNLRTWQELSLDCNFPSARANLPCGRFDSLKATSGVISGQGI